MEKEECSSSRIIRLLSKHQLDSDTLKGTLIAEPYVFYNAFV